MIPFFTYKEPLIHFHHSIDTAPDDADFIMHVHEHFEIYYFVSGDADFLIEGSRYPLEPGSLLITRPAETHRVRILSSKPYERYSINFSPDLLNFIDPDKRLLTPFTAHPLGQMNLFKSSDFHEELPLKFLEAMCAPASDEAERRSKVFTYFYPLLDIIYHAFLKQRNQGSSTQNPSEELIAYINQNLFEELSLDFLANRFFLSKSQLERRFKQATGSSVWEYITIKRLMAAREKIRNGQPVGSVFQECGFHDYSSFYRAYVRRFGISPKEDLKNGGH